MFRFFVSSFHLLYILQKNFLENKKLISQNKIYTNFFSIVWKFINQVGMNDNSKLEIYQTVVNFFIVLSIVEQIVFGTTVAELILSCFTNCVDYFVRHTPDDFAILLICVVRESSVVLVKWNRLMINYSQDFMFLIFSGLYISNCNTFYPFIYILLINS